MRSSQNNFEFEVAEALINIGCDEKLIEEVIEDGEIPSLIEVSSAMKGIAQCFYSEEQPGKIRTVCFTGKDVWSKTNVELKAEEEKIILTVKGKSCEKENQAELRSAYYLNQKGELIKEDAYVQECRCMDL